MNNKLLVLTLAAALGVGGVLTVNAGALGLRQGREPGSLLQRARQQLDVTDEQASQIRSIVKQDRKTLVALAQAVHESRLNLRDTIRDDTASEADVRAASAGLATAQANMAVERHKLFGKIKPILTAEQWNKLAQVQEQVDALVDGAMEALAQRLAE